MQSSARLITCVRVVAYALAIGATATLDAYAQKELREHSAELVQLEIASCFPPTDPYPYRLEKSDPFYKTARREHQSHLEAMEDYVNCLDRARAAAFNGLRASFNLFLENFGEDAILSYEGTE